MQLLLQSFIFLDIIFIQVVDSSLFFNKQFNKLLDNTRITAVYSAKGVFGCEKMCLEFGRQCAAVNVRQSLNNGFKCEIISEANIPTSITAEMMGPNPMGKFIRKTDTVDNCSPDPCLNGATCYDIGTTFRCECASTYAGTTCQLVIDICDPDPCQNSGTCVADGLLSYTCSCPPSHTGTVCENAMSYDCDTNNPCHVGSDRYYPHAETSFYVQCSTIDNNCFKMPCAAGVMFCNT